MAWIEWNDNPMFRRVGDCAVRALSKALGVDWEEAYDMLADAGRAMADMPSSNQVIAAVLRKNGFYRKAILDTCPECYTASDFCKDHPSGTFVLAFGNHVATVQDGDLYDTWDSSDEVPQYFFYRKDDR